MTLRIDEADGSILVVVDATDCFEVYQGRERMYAFTLTYRTAWKLVWFILRSRFRAMLKRR